MISALLLSCSTFALESDYEKPINVSSVSQHAQMKENRIVFQKDVLLTQGSIKITADKLTVIRGEQPNHEVMIADGNVATFYQTQDDGKPFDAEANSIQYDVAKGKITLLGNAQVKQLDSQINGEKIVYLLETEELIVNTSSDQSKRVNTVFLPAQFEKPKEQSAKNVKDDDNKAPEVPEGANSIEDNDTKAPDVLEDAKSIEKSEDIESAESTENNDTTIDDESIENIESTETANNTDKEE